MRAAFAKKTCRLPRGNQGEWCVFRRGNRQAFGNGSARMRCYHALMTILLSHTTALRFWRSSARRGEALASSRRASTQRARIALTRCKKVDIPISLLTEFESGAVDMLVGSKGVRVRTARVASHVWSLPVPNNSFCACSKNVVVSSPEFCFLQMASTLSIVELIQLGFELCGTYSMRDEGFSVADGSLTTVAQLGRFLEAAQGLRGLDKARRAVRYLINGSASPMETAFAMLLCLPYALGGYGIRRPQLNYRTEVPASLRAEAGRSICVFDMCWPALRLACEYDSNTWHSDAAAIDKDARRRNAMLILFGYRSITVSWAQVVDPAAFNRLARQIARATGKRLRYRDPGFTRAHFALRECVLPHR